MTRALWSPRHERYNGSERVDTHMPSADAQLWNCFLLRPSVRHQIPQLTREKIARTSGYHSPIMSGQFITTKPRLMNASTEKRTRNYSTGCLQIHRLDLSCLCVYLRWKVCMGLDIPDRRNVKQTMWMPAGLGNQLFCMLKGFDDTSNEYEESKPQSTSSSAQYIPVHTGLVVTPRLRCEPPSFTLEETS